MRIRYYACLSREVREMGGRQRVGLEFEIVEEINLNCFLNEENVEGSKDGNYEEVFENFRRYGMEHENFQKVKGRYLGETDFMLLTVYFEDLTYAMYQYGKWYCIDLTDREHGEELTGKVYDCAVCEWGVEDDPVINAYGSFEELGRVRKGRLRQLYRPYIPAESRWDGDIGENGLQAIGAGTVFDEVIFYYVGAALCAEIVDNAGNTAAFFDLGTRVSGNARLLNLQAPAQNSRNVILGKLQTIGRGNRVTIFISHWHVDHCNALGYFFHQNVLTPNIRWNTNWYVPGSNLPSFHAVQNSIPAASFHVTAPGAAQAAVNINHNVNIQAGKISYRGAPHPHHQGVYARVMLSSGTTVFLAGDTTYEGIPANERTNGNNGYTCLQACHHGGNYHYAPAVQNPAAGFIPQAEQNAIAVYSADGIYHGHPAPQYVGDHRMAGYSQANEFQLQQGAAQGFNLVRIT